MDDTGISGWWLVTSEGSCRHTTNAFINHLGIALGSHAEVETLVEIAFRLGYVSAEQRAALMATCDLTGRLLNGLLLASPSALAPNLEWIRLGCSVRL